MLVNIAIVSAVILMMCCLIMIALVFVDIVKSTDSWDLRTFVRLLMLVCVVVLVVSLTVQELVIGLGL